jgi:hypothetical protein
MDSKPLGNHTLKCTPTRSPSFESYSRFVCPFSRVSQKFRDFMPVGSLPAYVATKLRTVVTIELLLFLASKCSMLFTTLWYSAQQKRTRSNNFLYALYTIHHNFYSKDFLFILPSLFSWIHLASWEIPCVLLIIIEGSNKDNFAQVSPWAQRWREGTKGSQKSGAGGLLAEVMQDIQTLSAMAETEVAFKDYRSLA